MVKEKIVQMEALPQYRGFWGKHRYKVAVSGRASGKSVAAAQALLTLSMRYQIKILCCRQYQNSISDSSYAQLIDLIEMYGLDNEFEILRDKIICLRTGSSFIFKGLERNIRSIKSVANVNITWVEEAETVSQESWDVLIPTVMRAKGSEMWVCFNPRLPTDPTALLFLGEHPPEGMHLMRSNYNTNKYISKDMLKDILHMKEHDYKRYLHVYEGQFEDVGDSKLFPYELLKESVNRTPIHEDVPAIAALDVARFGDDRSVLCVRQGNRITSLQSWQGLDLMTLARAVSNVLMNEGIKTLVVDGVGVGAGSVDIFKSIIGNVCRIIEFNGGYKANDNHFINARVETYHLAKKWLSVGQLPNNDSLIKELSSIEYKFNNKHQLQLESKKELKQRIGVSPDYSDAFTMTFFIKAGITPTNVKKLQHVTRGSTWT
jgi:phage terminase large subunit